MLKQRNDGLTRVWKADKVHKSFYSGGKITFTDDGKTFACIHDDNLIFSDWGRGHHQPDTLFDGKEDSHEIISSFCLHPTESEVVICTQHSLLHHYNISNKTLLKTIKHPLTPVLTMDYDSSGTLVVTGSADHCVRVYDIIRGHCTHSFKEHRDIIHLVKFHPDPNQLKLISTSEDTKILIYDLVESKAIAAFHDHMSVPTSICFSADGYILSTAGRDKVMNFFELRHNTHMKTVPVMEELESIVMLNSTHSIACYGSDSCTSGVKAGKNANKTAKMNSGEFSYVVVTAGATGVLHTFRVSIMGKDVSSFRCEALRRVPTNSVSSTISSTNTLLRITSMHYISKRDQIVVVNDDHNIITFTIGEPIDNAADEADHVVGDLSATAEDGESNRVNLHITGRIIGCNDDILDMVVVSKLGSSSDDGAQENVIQDASFCIALISNSSQVRLLDHNMDCRPLEGHSDIVLSADVSPDGEWLATSGKDHTCRLWHLASGLCAAVAEGHGDAVGAVAISQCPGSYKTKQVVMISGAGDKTLKRWPILVHSLIQQLQRDKYSFQAIKLSASDSVRAHDKDVNAIALAPNDAMLASGSQDKSIRLWNTSDLSPLATLTGHKRGVWRVVFSPVDRVLASCSGDHTVKLWSVLDYTCLRTFQGHTCSVLSVKFINRGQQLISGSSDGLIRLWTIRTGECENAFDMHEGKVWALAVLSESMFISGGSDASLILWKDHTEEEELLRLTEIESNLKTEQQMQNDIRNKRYGKALFAAIELCHSNRILTILRAILEDESAADAGVGRESLTTTDTDRKLKRPRVDKEKCALDSYVAQWSDSDIEKIVGYLKDWNTNAKHTYVCQVLLSSILRVIRMERLLGLRSVVDSLSGLISYCDRHYQRIDRLHQATYVVEYVQALMTGLPVVSDLGIAMEER